MKQFDFLKKTLLLSAFCLIGMSANAQGMYTVANSETFSVGEEYINIPNITLVYGGDATLDAYLGTSKAVFMDGTETSTDFSLYCNGNGHNPKDADDIGFDKSGNLPVKGTYYVLKPAVAGSLKIAVVINAAKKFFIVEDGKALADYNGITVGVKSSLIYTFNVKANSTYYVFSVGSKLGFGGFVYTCGNPTSVKSVEAVSNANAPIYNLTGQRVTKTVKGLYIQNGRKYMVK